MAAPSNEVENPRRVTTVGLVDVSFNLLFIYLILFCSTSGQVESKIFYENYMLDFYTLHGQNKANFFTFNLFFAFLATTS